MLFQEIQVDEKWFIIIPFGQIYMMLYPPQIRWVFLGLDQLDPQLFFGREGNENYNIESKVHRGSRMSLSSCSAWIWPVPVRVDRMVRMAGYITVCSQAVRSINRMAAKGISNKNILKENDMLVLLFSGGDFFLTTKKDLKVKLALFVQKVAIGGPWVRDFFLLLPAGLNLVPEKPTIKL